MNQETWQCPKCKHTLLVTRLNDREWQALRTVQGSVLRWKFHQETWWHRHKEGYTICDGPI